MLRSRINYWSCSNFANWLRGEDKPMALTSEEWEEWRDKAKSKHPIRFWLAEELLDKIQDFFYFPKDIYNSIRHYYLNRFVTKTHFLKTGLEPGKYHELDERILHGLFNELIDFVECEQAWLNHICSKENNFKFKRGRCPEAGLDYLRWACSLKKGEDWILDKDDAEYNEPTPQALAAKKVLELYNWWKYTRPNRPDPMEVSGWADYCDNKNKYTKEESRVFLEKLDQLEAQYDQEDENMLIELIKVRKSLWT